MVTLRLFAHMILPITNEVENNHFRAIEICENTAQLLAKQFNGKIDCSSSGCVQYSDTVILNTLSEKDEQFIISTYPFVKVRRPLFGNKFYS